jgi:uncharacterized membrane protein YvbJ
MSKNNTKKPSKYGWIFYAAILVFIAVNLFGGLAFNSTEKTTTSQLEDFMKQGDVAKVVIITNTRQAKVFLTPEASLKKSIEKCLKVRYFHLRPWRHNTC